MKRILLFLLPVLMLLGYHYREAIIDFLPIDQSGWSTNDFGNCYLDEDGDPVSGWQEIDGIAFYFTPETHTPHNGWATRNGVSCYLSEGRPVNGWVTLAEGTFYLREDGSIHTGWLTENEQLYYLDTDGNPVSGWTETDKGTFYFDEAGRRCTGLTEIDGTVYCLDHQGNLHTGWYQQEGKRYYANADSTLYTGWLESDGKWYYLQEDGSAAVGKKVIHEIAYFFSSTGMNFIMVNPWHPVPEDYNMNFEIYEGHSVAPECLEDLKQMLEDCKAAGHSPRILSGYRSIKNQTLIFNHGMRTRMAQGYTYDQAYDLTRQSIAIPGTSEHHLGLAMDIVDSRYLELDETQEETPTQQWLMENCWKYGFIMRYPNGDTDITGITYEPWHYRYVGIEMAKEIHELGVCLEVYIDMLTNDGTTCGGQQAVE